MFRAIIADLDKNFGKLDSFHYYLDRHVHLGKETHAPLAMQMMEELCGDDEIKWEKAKQVAINSLKANYWDGIEQVLKIVNWLRPFSDFLSLENEFNQKLHIMFKKISAVTLVMVLGFFTVKADEGMWLPLLLSDNEAEMQELGCN